MRADPAISFRPLARSDLERLCGWLNRPHVYEWWGRDSGDDALGGSGSEAATPEQVEAKYQPTIDAGEMTRRFVIQVDERPVGLIQCYRLSDEPEYALEIGEDAATVTGIDLLVGESDHVGRGLGGRVIDAFVRTIVFADERVTRAVAGPDVRNVRSIRAFEKAGFRAMRDVVVAGEPHPERIMVRDRG